MKYVIYTRLSIQKDDSSDSHDMQLKKCQEIVGDATYLTFSESNISGDVEIEKCPKLYKALNSLKPGDVFLIWKMDRLSRDLIKMAKILQIIEKKKAVLQSATEPNFFDDNMNAQLIRNITMVIAEHELKTIRFRVKSALAAKKAKGQRVGYIPYGYHLEGLKMLAPDDIEQEMITLFEELYFGRGYTYRQVAEYLSSKEIWNREGRQWSYSSVCRILKNRLRHAEVFQRLNT